MKSLSRVAGEAAVGLGIGIGLADTLTALENNPAHITLVHGGQDAESPAPEVQIYIHTNRQERRFLKLAGEVWRAANSPEHTQLVEELCFARRSITENTRLSRLGRQ